MTTASIRLQDLQRRLYVKAKAEKDWRFWGLYVHVVKLETLHAAYKIAQEHNGAPGIDGVTFGAIEAAGVEPFLTHLRAAAESARRDSQGGRHGPRPGDSGDTGPGGARGAQTDLGADLRSRLSGRVVWVSPEADRPAGG
jgi:hypothetical protein